MNEIETIVAWNEAVELFKSSPGELASARLAADKLETLISSNPQQGISKLCYNVAILRKYLGDDSSALQYLNLCLSKDPHNAIAYYQRGTVNYHLDRFVESAKDFQKCIECMRQSTIIDYTQLGLRCRLYQHEAIFNEGACHLKLGNRKNCVAALLEVKSLIAKDGGAPLKALDINARLENAQKDGGSLELIEGALDKLYTPPVAKLNNIAKKNYLGTAKVVSSVQSGDTFAGFEGPKQIHLPKNVKNLKKRLPDRPSSPRPATPTQQLSDSTKGPAQSSSDKPLLAELISSQQRLLLSDSRPEAPVHPPPKPQSRPAPAVRSATGGLATHKAPPVSPNDKPVTSPKPALCKVELLAGELSQIVLLPLTTNYHKLMDSVRNAFDYASGTYSIWYLNRQGTYTAIDNQEIVDHVWKWKVKDNLLTIYVFGV